MKSGYNKTGNAVIMTRGKYIGIPIHKIPSQYLRYVAENWEEKTKEQKRIVKACDDEWIFREKYNNHFEEDD
jgi:hypothetical protein